MQKALFSVIGGVVFVALGLPAHATVRQINCTGNASTDQASFSTALGGGTYPSLSSGDIIQLNATAGTPSLCAGDYRFVVNVTIENHLANSSLQPNDGFNGMLEIAASHAVINGITLEGTSLNANTTSTATVPSGFNEAGALVAESSATVLLENSQVGPSAVSGIYAVRSSEVGLTNTTVFNNGQGSGGNSYGVPYSAGIFASEGSSIRLGEWNGTIGDTIGGNGLQSGTGCPGFGIVLAQSASLISYGATIGGSSNGTADTDANTCGQMVIETGSSVRLEGTTVTQTNAQGTPALRITTGSSLLTEPNSFSAATTSITGASGGAVLLGGASVAVFNSTTLTATGNSGNPAVIEASGSSNMMLAGGNIITNATSGGLAIQIDHSSSFLHLQGTHFGYSNQVESLTGAGVVQEQSSMDLGQGLVSSSPSISWTTGSGGIQVQQNSSFRVSGGVAIAGAVTITQGSNGFANTANSGTNAITSANCPFTSVPSSHWASPGKVSSAVPSATIYASATSPQCLAF